MPNSLPFTFTIHIGARRIPVEELSWEYAMDHLKGLTEHGYSRNVTVCLENLVGGWTGNPEKLMEMATSSGAGVTFDIGHARGGEWVQEGHGTALEFLNIVAPKVLNAHVYEYEDEKGEHLVPHEAPDIPPRYRTPMSMNMKMKEENTLSQIGALRSSRSSIDCLK